MLKLFIYISLYLFLNHAAYLEAALRVVALSFVVAYYAATAAAYGKIYASRAVFVFRGSSRHPVKISKLRIDEITVLGSRCGQFGRALRLLEAKRIDFSPLITDIYSVDDAIKAFERNKDKDSIKVLIKF